MTTQNIHNTIQNIQWQCCVATRNTTQRRTWHGTGRGGDEYRKEDGTEKKDEDEKNDEKNNEEKEEENEKERAQRQGSRSWLWVRSQKRNPQHNTIQYRTNSDNTEHSVTTLGCNTEHNTQHTTKHRQVTLGGHSLLYCYLLASALTRYHPDSMGTLLGSPYDRVFVFVFVFVFVCASG